MIGPICIAVGVAFLTAGIALSAAPKKRADFTIVSAPAAIPASPRPWGLHMSDIDLAVLRAIPFERYNENAAMDGRVTDEKLATERDNIAKTRKWAATLEDGPVKAAYMGWLDAFERWTNEAEHEMRTHAKANAQAEESARIHAVKARIPIPSLTP